jgi:hypothetical protein
MSFEYQVMLLAAALFAAMLALQEVARRRAERRRESQAGGGIVDGAVFALLGLLIAFTFSGAASRFDTRRGLIIDEANAISTAYLRIDLLPAAAQPGVRALFRNYLDARLAAYRALPDLAAAKSELARAAAVQQEIWARAIESTAGLQPATMLVLPALNHMFDIATTRTVQTQMHPPTVIFALLIALALVSAYIAGDAIGSAGKGGRLHMLAFAFTLAAAVYVIIDIEYPRLGLIRVDAFDRALVEVREAMN